MDHQSRAKKLSSSGGWRDATLLTRSAKRVTGAANVVSAAPVS